jgi:mannose-1-phosphate guanylyltransferase
MRALLLAAGVGSRLRPVTDTIPKCLVPVLGRPLLGYWLELLFAGGCERVLINTHHFSDRVHEFVASSPWRHRVDLAHEDRLLGTGGTIVANAGYFENAAGLVGHADNLTKFDMKEFSAAHTRRPRYCAMSMMAFRTDTPSSCGILETDSEGVVQAFHEKVENPPGNLANAAVYILEPEVLAFAVGLEKTVLDFQTEVIPTFMGRIMTFENTSYHRDIGTPESLAKANAEFPVDD